MLLLIEKFCRPMVHPQVSCKLLKFSTIKLDAIIWNEDTRYSKLAYDVAPYEINHLTSSDALDSFSLWTFGEIFYCDYHKFTLASGLGQRTEDVNSPLEERPGRRDSGLVHCRGIDSPTIQLANITSLHKFFHIRFQGQPVVSLPENFID